MMVQHSINMRIWHHVSTAHVYRLIRLKLKKQNTYFSSYCRFHVRSFLCPSLPSCFLNHKICWHFTFFIWKSTKFAVYEWMKVFASISFRCSYDLDFQSPNQQCTVFFQHTFHCSLHNIVSRTRCEITF